MWTNNLQQAYDSALSLKLVKARELLEQERVTNPDNALVEYVEDQVDFVSLLVTDNRNEYQALEKRESKRLSRLEKETDGSAWQRFAQAEILLHWALMRIKFDKSYMGALLSFRRSYKLLEENNKLHPDFLANGKTLGILKVLVGTTPSGYQWLLRLLGYSATVSEGLQQLDKATLTGSTHQLEAHLFKANTLTYVLKQPDRGTAILDSLYKLDSTQIVIGFFLSAALQKAGKSDQAYQVLDKLPKSYPYMPLYLIAYQMGNILMYKGQYHDALRYFQHYLTYYQGESNRADAWYKMYLAAMLTNQPQRANLYRKNCLEVKNLVTEADKNAQSQLQINTVFEPTLMTARLYCDGGYYRRAKDYLAPFSDADYIDQILKAEFAYRQARIQTGLGIDSLAAPLYSKSLRMADGTQAIFSANAALELGFIMMRSKQWQQAKEYLEMARKLKNPAYGDGIERKAKAALAEVETHL